MRSSEPDSAPNRRGGQPATSGGQEPDDASAASGSGGTTSGDPTVERAAETPVMTKAFDADTWEAAEEQLAALYPSAHLELYPDLCYLARRTIEHTDPAYASIIAALGDSPLLPSGQPICVFDFSLPDQSIIDLETGNIVNRRLAPELRDGLFYQSLIPGALAAEQLLTPAQRDAFLFAPAARKLEHGWIFSVDHHYPYKAVCTACATVLTVDFIDYLHRTDRQHLIQRLENAFAVMDHCDADMLLSHFARRIAHDRDFLLKHGELLKDAALLNDFGELRGDGRHREAVQMLYWVMKGIEARINSREYSICDGLDLVRSAVEFASAHAAEFPRASEGKFPAVDADERRHLQHLVEGMRGFKEECALLEAMAVGYRPDDQAAGDRALQPGTFTKLGSMLFAYIPSSSRELENFSVLMFARLYHPEMLEGVGVVASSSPVGAGSDPARPRMFRMRSFVQPDGRFIDLCGVHAVLNGPLFGEIYHFGGRTFAIGADKGPVFGMNVNRVARDAARAVALVSP